MKLHFDRDWAKRRLTESPDEEPYVIGGLPMDSTAVVDTWISGKIEDLELKIREELQLLMDRYDNHDETMFTNMGNTDTLKWKAQIEVLKEFEEFLDKTKKV